MRLLIFTIAALLLFPGICRSEETGAFTKDGSSLYEYDENNPPEAFFFPPEKARWNGYKVTMAEWYLLTDLQKERFISEYMGELNRQYHAALESIGLDDYIRALNLFSYYSNNKTMNEPSTKFVDKLLSGQGKMPEKPK